MQVKAGHRLMDTFKKIIILNLINNSHIEHLAPHIFKFF